MTRKYIFAILLIILSSCEKSLEPNNMIVKFYGDALEDIGYSIAPTSDGYVIGGQLTKVKRLQSNYIDIAGYVNTEGNTIWKNGYGKKLSGTGTKIITLDDGSFVIAGYVTDTVSPFKRDIYVVKTSADSTTSIEKIYKMTGDQYGIDIIKTDEGFMVLGSTDVGREPVTESSGNTAGKRDLLFLRINNDLNQIGSPVAFGFPDNDAGAAIKKDINGDYIVVGTTERSDLAKTKQDKSNILIARVNSVGNVTESRILGGLEDEYAADFEVLPDGYFIAGNIGAEGTVQQVYTWGLTTDIQGDPLYANPIDLEPGLATKTSASVKAICRYKLNSYIIAGQFGTGSSGRMLFFIADASGGYVDGKKLIFGGTGTQIAYDVISDTDNNIIAVGKNSYENNSMISLIKFRF
jgi:hypothetical protein